MRNIDALSETPQTANNCCEDDDDGGEDGNGDGDRDDDTDRDRVGRGDHGTADDGADGEDGVDGVGADDDVDDDVTGGDDDDGGGGCGENHGHENEKMTAMTVVDVMVLVHQQTKEQ